MGNKEELYHHVSSKDLQPPSARQGHKEESLEKA